MIQRPPTQKPGRRRLIIVLVVLALGIIGALFSEAPALSPEELGKNVRITDVQLVEFTAANGKPAQSLVFTLTNDNDVPVYAVDGIYRLTLDGSGLLAPAGVKEISYCLYARKLEPHASVTKTPGESFIILTQTEGRCSYAEVTATKAEAKPWYPEQK